MGRRTAEKAKIICPHPSGVDIIMSLNSQVVNFGSFVIGWILFVILHFTVLILLISGSVGINTH